MQTKNQLKFLTAMLTEKEKEYNLLCKKFELLKQQNLDPNATAFKLLRDAFIKNQNEIILIKQKLSKLK